MKKVIFLVLMALFSIAAKAASEDNQQYKFSADGPMNIEERRLPFSLVAPIAPPEEGSEEEFKMEVVNLFSSIPSLKLPDIPVLGWIYKEPQTTHRKINWKRSSPNISGWTHEDGTWDKNPHYLSPDDLKRLKLKKEQKQHECEELQEDIRNILHKIEWKQADIEQLACECPKKCLEVKCADPTHLKEKLNLDGLIYSLEKKNNMLCKFRLALSNLKIRLDHVKDATEPEVKNNDSDSVIAISSEEWERVKALMDHLDKPRCQIAENSRL